MTKKYFFFDIDGTLTYGEPGQRVPPASAKEAIRKLQENGHFVAIATGRSYPGAVDIMKEFGIHHMVSDGGNGITINDRLLEVEPLDKDKCIALINECKSKKIPWAISPNIDRNKLCDSVEFQKVSLYPPEEVKIIADFDPEGYENIYKVYVAGKEEELETLKDLPHCRYNKRCFFVEPTQKEKGIYRIMEYLNAPVKDVVVFGDGLNDLSMFIDEWMCIGMADGAREIIEKADYVTDAPEKDGIYKACEKFGWI